MDGKGSFGATLVTVGIVVLNREWAIGKMLDSLLSQTFPHEKIYVVVVDGQSSDGTVDTARRILESSDLMGYEIVVKKCSIPEGRNICIEKMRGEMLFFWDSDVVIEPNGLCEFVEIMEKERASIVTGHAKFIFIKNTLEEAEKEINAALDVKSEVACAEVPSAGMGHTLVSRAVFDSIRFDEDLTIMEDYDFSTRARGKGFRIIANKNVKIFDINNWGERYSDIHMDMPLKDALRGIRKKAKAQALGYAFEFKLSSVLKFFFDNKRYLVYLGYLPMVIVTIVSILLNNYIMLLALPIYLSLFLCWQICRRGVKGGFNAVLRSILVGLPSALWLVYYFSKIMINK